MSVGLKRGKKELCIDPSNTKHQHGIEPPETSGESIASFGLNGLIGSGILDRGRPARNERGARTMSSSAATYEVLADYTLKSASESDKSIRASRSLRARRPRSVCGSQNAPNLRTRVPPPIIRLHLAHWCSWLTRCPLKAEITGSSPVCATKKTNGHRCKRWPLIFNPT